MGIYPNGRGINLQLADGVGLTISFVIVSDFWWRTSSEVFHESGLWWRSPHWHRLDDFGVFILFYLPNGRLTPTVLEGGPFQNGPIALNTFITMKVCHQFTSVQKYCLCENAGPVLHNV
jgi:hypothetical protein